MVDVDRKLYDSLPPHPTDAPNQPQPNRRKRKIIAICAVSVLVVCIVVSCAFYFGVIKKAKTIPTSGDHYSYPPDQPDSPSALDVNITSIHIQWSKPSSNTAEILRYVVNISGNASDSQQISAPARDFELLHLLGSTTYCFNVAACSSVGCGNFSIKSCFETLKPEIPTPVQGAVIKSTSSNSIVMEWENVDDMGAGIDMYEVEAKLASSEADYFTQYCMVSSTECKLGNLHEGSEYDIRIRAHNKIGFSAWSPEFFHHTDLHNASIPEAPSHLGAHIVSPVEVQLHWKAPSNDGGAEIVDFLVQIAKDTVFSVDTQVLHSNLLLNVYLTNLDTNAAYFARVCAINSRGSGVWSPTLNFSTDHAKTPLAPETIEVMSTKSTQLTISWDVPEDEGSPIIKYELQMDNFWFSKALETIATVSENFYTTTDSEHLVPGSSYLFSVRAINFIGPGDWSSQYIFRTDTAGSCGNPGDVGIFSKLRSNIRPMIQSSFFKCVTSGESCAIADIVKNTGLTHDCATCWGNLGQCSLKNCLFQCVNPKSDSCTSCSRSKCFPAAAECTGLPVWLLDSLPS